MVISKEMLCGIVFAIESIPIRVAPRVRLHISKSRPERNVLLNCASDIHMPAAIRVFTRSKRNFLMLI